MRPDVVAQVHEFWIFPEEADFAVRIVRCGAGIRAEDESGEAFCDVFRGIRAGIVRDEAVSILIRAGWVLICTLEVAPDV